MGLRREMAGAMAGVICFCLAAAASSTKVEPIRIGPATRAARLAIPDVSLQMKARQIVYEAFRDEFAAKDREGRLSLARRLLEQAGQTRGDPAARYVMLGEARDLAVAAKDPGLAWRAVRMLDEQFVVDAGKMLLIALREVGSQAAARWALRAVPDAVAEEDFFAAEGLVQFAAGEGDETARRGAGEWGHQIQALRDISRKAEQARQLLAASADDPAANRQVGWHLCAVRGDWTAGLKHLAKGNDRLAPLAGQEMANPADVPQLMELANAWWDLAQTEHGLIRRNVEAHAVWLYRGALPRLAGLHRALAQERIETFQERQIADRGLVRGLAAALHKGTDFGMATVRRVDATVDFDWGEDAPDGRVGKDNFSIRWEGYVRFSQAGAYELVVQANMGARVWINDRLVAEGANLTRSRNGLRANVEVLEAGVYPLRIDYWDTGGLAKMRLLWKLPGAGADEVIPANALYHEP